MLRIKSKPDRSQSKLTLWLGWDSASRLICITDFPTKSLKCKFKCLLNNVLWDGIESRAARRSDVNKGSWTIRAPWTPEPRKFGEYSDKLAVLNHSITLLLVHRETNSGVVTVFACKEKKVSVINSQYFWKWTNANPMKIFGQLASHPKLGQN